MNSPANTPTNLSTLESEFVDVTPLDPVRQETFTTPTADDPMLLAILGAKNDTAKPEVSNVIPFPKRKVAVRSAVTAALVAALVALPAFVGSTPKAFADWNPVPQEIGDGEEVSYADICAVDNAVTITDKRGSNSLTMWFGKGDEYGSFGTCMTDGKNMYGSAITSASDNPTNNNGSPKMEELEDGAVSWSSDTYFLADGPISVLAGAAAPNVKAVSATFMDGTVVQATLKEGFWVMWVPIRQTENMPVEPFSSLKFTRNDGSSETGDPSKAAVTTVRTIESGGETITVYTQYVNKNVTITSDGSGNFDVVGVYVSDAGES
jgi:hypothetical protein